MTTGKILIVEDETIVQLHLSKILCGMGCIVTGMAATAEEAFRCASETTPDLVLMDIHLRGNDDGIETAKRLKSQYDVGIVFVSAYADETTVERTGAADAVGYIVKPFSEREVRAVITTALAEHGRTREREEREKSLSSILQSLGDAVFVLDGVGRVTFMNPRAEALTSHPVGLPAEEIIPLHDEDVPLFKSTIEHTLRTGQSQSLSTMNVMRADGSDVMMEGYVEPLDGSGRSEGLIISLRELTLRWNNAASTDRARRPGHSRILIYSHDTFGLGHLRRCLNLSWALTRRHRNLSILLVTGSSVAHRYELPPRVDYVKLPAVRKVARESYEARSLNLPDDGVLQFRSNLLLRTVRDFEPDLLLVDHSPVGMRSELLPALEWLHIHRPHCVKTLGLRDIIDEPAALIESWTRAGIYQVLDKLYDQVVVYGLRQIFDPVEAYRFSPAVADRTTFLSYVREEESSTGQNHDTNSGGRNRVVVTVGGGDGAAELIIGNYLDMVDRNRDRIDFDTVILPGPLAPAELVAEYKRRCSGLPIEIHEFVESTSPYMRASDLVVSTGGYNTTVQVLCNARRSVIIPRVMHRKEQWLRASRLAELHAVQLIDPNDVSPELLFDVVTEQLASPDEPLVDARARNLLRFDGAERFAELCTTLLTRASLTQESRND